MVNYLEPSIIFIPRLSGQLMQLQSKGSSLDPSKNWYKEALQTLQCPSKNWYNDNPKKLVEHMRHRMP